MSRRNDPQSIGSSSSARPWSGNLSGLEADDPGQVVQELFHWSQKLVGIDGAIFFLVGETELEARFVFELPTPIVEELHLSLEDDGPIQACLTRNATQVITTKMDLKPGVAIPWAVSACIPLTIEGIPIGVYAAGWNAPFDIGRDTLLVLEGAASLAASSVHRARLLYQVKREEQRLRTLLDRLPIPALGFSTPELTVNHVNAEARRLLGDARGKQVRETLKRAEISPVDAMAGGDAIDAFLSPTGFTRFRLTAVDGSTRIVFPSLAHLGAGGAVIMLVDVTHETNLEMQRKRFVRMISHHLRTPLTPLLGYADVVANESKPSVIRQAATEISAAIAQLINHVERLEQIADLQPLDEVSIGLSPVESLVVAAWDMAGGITDDLSLGSDVDLEVICNPAYVIRAMAEIFVNAYGHGRPPIEVEWHAVKSEAVISCRDSGSGISAEWESAVFAPYLTTQGGYEAPVTGQLGLGLTLARALIEATHGRLTYEDGSFVIRLPLQRPSGS